MLLLGEIDLLWIHVYALSWNTEKLHVTNLIH